MKKSKLMEQLKKVRGEEVLLRGQFGNTYMDIDGVYELEQGQILLKSARDPIPAPQEVEADLTLELSDLVFEIKQFVGTEPEIFQGVGIGFERVETEVGPMEKIYLEAERDDGTFGLVSMGAEEALWVSQKLWDYAAKTKR